MKLMKIAWFVVAILVTIALFVVVVGWSLPVKHRASRQVTYAAAPAVVFAALTRIEDYPSWRSKVSAVQSLDAVNGARSYRESGGDGDITYVVDQSEADRRLVVRIADKSLPFGGRWTYVLAPSGQGTTLRITEDGEVYNPIFRFVSRYVIGHYATVDTYLKDLGRKLGEPDVVIATSD